MAKRLVGRVMWAERTRRIFTLGFVAALAAVGCVHLLNDNVRDIEEGFVDYEVLEA